MVTTPAPFMVCPEHNGPAAPLVDSVADEGCVSVRVICAVEGSGVVKMDI